MDTQRTKRIMSILANGKTDRIGQGLMDTVIDIVTADEDNLDFLIDKLLRLIQRAQPEDKFWVAAVEALMVANFEQATIVTEALLRALKEQHGGVITLYPIAMIGALKAVNWAYGSDIEANPVFEDKFPTLLGEMVVGYASNPVTTTFEAPSDWLLGQFSNELAEYLEKCQAINECWRRRAVFAKACIKAEVVHNSAEVLVDEVIDRLRINLSYAEQFKIISQQLDVRAAIMAPA